MKSENKITDIERLRNSLYCFKDRSEAGKILADLIRKKRQFESPEIALAIPAGGVPVGVEISRELKLPFDVLVVRKIQLPHNTEAGFGAIGPDEEIILNQDLLKKLKLSPSEIEAQIEKTKKIISQRVSLFRGDKPFPDLKDLTVILVDDGLASGYTMRESIKYVKRKKAKEVILAVPTAPLDTILSLIDDVDQIYCPNIREYYPFAVADAYKNWQDLTDDDVIALLKSHNYLP